VLTIEDLTLLQLRTNTPYRLYIRLLSGLAKPKSILSLILLPPLTAFKYGKVINRKLHLYRALASLNIPLYPLAYITTQAASKAILITPYRTTCNRLWYPAKPPLTRLHIDSLTNTLTNLVTNSVTDSVNYPFIVYTFYVYIPPNFHRFRIKSLMQFSHTCTITLP